MKGGKTDEACEKFAESQKAAPRAGTLLELASCHEKQGKIATAWSEYIDAEADARKEGNKPVEKDAQGRSRKIEIKVPRVTVTVPVAVSVQGLEVKIDGVLIDRGDWGKPRPIDPGDHKITATAPNKKDGEQAFSIKVAEKKSVAIAALVDGAPSTPTPPPTTDKPKPDAVETKPDETQKPPPEPEKPQESWRKAKRWVWSASAQGGFLLGEIPRSSLPGLSTYDYEYFVSRSGELSKLVAKCDDNCYGIFHWEVGGYAGGQAFFGYAMSDTLQLGARVFGAYRFGGGFVILGGPSLSMRLADQPLWIGGTLVVGGVQQNARVLGIKGAVPEESQALNNNQDEVDVPPKINTPPEAQSGTFSFGLSLEVSYTLLDHPATSWMSGALEVSAWPTFVKGLEGFAVAVPVGIGYRFY